MELTEISYFLTIAENKSLLRASEELFVSQSALSQFLTKLEKRVGTPLFLREKESKRLRLTEAGEIYYEGARKISAIKKKTLEDIGKLSEQEQLTIRLGTTGVRSLRFSAMLLAHLQQEEPKARMCLSNNNSRTIGPQLLNHTLDFSLIALNYFDDAEVKKVVLHSEEIGLCIPLGHPFLRRIQAAGISPDVPMDISLLQNESLILPSEGSVLERICNSYFQQEDFHPSNALKAYENSSLIDSVKSVSSVGMTSYGYARNEKEIVFQRLIRPAHYDLGIAYRRDFKLSALQERFLELAREYRACY